MNLLNQILFFVLFMYCVILHEVAHGYAARISGDDTAYLSGRLTLDPLAHIDLMGTVVLPLLLYIIGSPVLFGWAKPVPINCISWTQRAFLSKCCWCFYKFCAQPAFVGTV